MNKRVIIYLTEGRGIYLVGLMLFVTQRLLCLPAILTQTI